MMYNSSQLEGILNLLKVGASAEAAEMVLVPAEESSGPTRRSVVGRGEIMTDRGATEQMLLLEDVTDRRIATAWVGSIASLPIAGPSAERGWLAIAHHAADRFDDETLQTLIVAAQLVEDHLDAELEQAELNKLSESLVEDHDCLLESQSQLKQANLRLSHRASTDSLTGLANRRKIQESLAASATAASPSKELLEANRAIAVIDLDQFKVVNDTHGHNIGDALLAAVAGRISSHIGPADLAGRWGGDEFIVVFEGPIALGAAEKRAAALSCALQAPYTVDGHVLEITASIGVALEWPGHDSVGTIAAADRKMYRNKSHASR